MDEAVGSNSKRLLMAESFMLLSAVVLSVRVLRATPPSGMFNLKAKREPLSMSCVVLLMPKKKQAIFLSHDQIAH